MKGIHHFVIWIVNCNAINSTTQKLSLFWHWIMNVKTTICHYFRCDSHNTGSSSPTSLTINTTSNNTVTEVDYLSYTVTTAYEVVTSSINYGGIYIALIISMIVLGLIRCWLYFTIVVNSAKALHNKLYHSVVRAPIRFFDKTPKGKSISVSFF